MRAAPRSFPTPVSAVLLSLMGAFFTAAIAVSVSGWASPTAAVGIGTVLGLGGAGMLGAANVPPPHAERVGLRLPRARQIAGVLLLIPVAILASEVDNTVTALFPPPEAQPAVQASVDTIPVDARLSAVETAIVAVGLIPVVEEWFFRGVLQQGLVASLGAAAGVFSTSLLFALGHGAGLSVQAWGSLVAQTLVLGLAFGIARHRTGSLLAPIGLHAGVNGLSIAAIAAAEQVPIAGYNAPGAHTPAAILAASAASVGLGLWWLARDPVPPIPVAPLPDERDLSED